MLVYTHTRMKDFAVEIRYVLTWQNLHLPQFFFSLQPAHFPHSTSAAFVGLPPSSSIAFAGLPSSSTVGVFDIF